MGYNQRVAPIKGKLNVVREWETATNVKDIRSFLGFANYYRQFVPGYANIAALLTMLTKKGVLWDWGPLQSRAFDDLKSADLPKSVSAIQSSVRRFGGYYWRSVAAGPNRRPATSGIHETSIQTHQKMVLSI